jgi:hypothetical protein
VIPTLVVTVFTASLNFSVVEDIGLNDVADVDYGF